MPKGVYFRSPEILVRLRLHCSKIGRRFPKGHKLNVGSRSGLYKHGLRSHPCYRIWKGMMHRCYNRKTPYYDIYGGKGIEVWRPWHDPVTFILGLSVLLGDRPEGFTQDRWNPHEGYYEWNVRWADAKTQTRNNRKAISYFYAQSGEH